MNLKNKIELSKVGFAVLELILGILLICMPNTTLITICYVIGAVIVVSGVILISNNVRNVKSPIFITGVVQAVTGLLFIFLSNIIIKENIFIIVVSIILIAVGVLKILASFNAKTILIKKWWINLIYGVLLIILSIILLCNPFGAQTVMIMFLGTVVLFDAICRFVSHFTINDVLKEFNVKKGSNKEKNKDAEVIEVKEEDIVVIKEDEKK